MNKHKHISKQRDQKQRKNGNIQSKRVQDKRFQTAQYDPKFIAPNSKISKIKIDKRFADKLQSDKFKIAGAVDKYGRYNEQKSGMEEMDDYYYAEDEQKKNNKISQKHKQKKIKQVQVIQQNQDQISESNIQNEQQKMQKNIAKWMDEYNEQSSDGMDDENLDEFAEQSEGIWSDDDDNVIKGQDVQVTRRLALCNYDWMNINAKDLMLLFSSFKPAAGTVLSVAVYFSQIGKEKMKIQELYGPQGIWNQKTNNDGKQTKNKYKKRTFESDKNEEQAFDLKKLRAYEKQRLKYCYAIIQCNSKKTADQIYKECDGNQFENSNLLFDLRFVPDDLQLDPNMLKQKCDELPVSGEVKNFISRALGHSKVTLTWEDPQLNSIASLKKKNWNKISDKQLDNIDWGMYMNEQNQQASDNFNQIIGKSTRDQAQENNIDDKKLQNVSDWRKQYNKKYRNQDELQIIFPSGFDKGTTTKEQKPSLNKQMKSRKQRWQSNKDEKKKRQQMELLVQKDEKQQFHYNPEDERFKAVFNNPMYSIDPVDPKFDHRRTGEVFEEVVKRNKKKNLL